VLLTVVRCAPYGGEVPVEERGVALHAQLVRAQDMRHVVDLEELVHDA
jgi:hypothetical protein